MRTTPVKKSRKKKAYAKPALVRYGEVRALTQTATTGSKEGTGGAGIMKPGSDRGIKENIALVGRHPLGFGIYLFNYKAEYRALYGNGRQFGVMADEVEAVVPEAVSRHPAGHQQVDYGLLGILRS